MRQATLRLCVFLILGLLGSTAVAAGRQPLLRSFDAATVTPAGLAHEARGSAPGDLFRITGLRGAGGETLTLALEAAPLFAADFRLYVDGVDRGGEAAARLTFLRGTVEEWPGSSVALVVDGASGTWNGMLVAGEQVLEMTLPSGPDHGPIAGSVVLRQTEAEALPAGLMSDALEPPRGMEREVPAAKKIIVAPGGEYAATIAVESDHEFFQLYGSEAVASSYLAGVMATVSELYFRQLGVSLAVSSISLYTSPDDPWNAPNPHSGDRADVLCEFARYWQANRPVGAFPRSGAVFFTGKPSGDIGGQAWRSSLCSFSAPASASCPFGGYGIVVASQRALRDSFITAHELGHVFGSAHTHCYNPPIDQCHSGEARCYNGDVSPPLDGGSVMSYCGLFNLSLGEPGKYGVDSQRVVQVMRSFIDLFGRNCLERTGDPYDLAGEAGERSVKLTWSDPFGTESNWLVEQRLPNGKFKQVKSLPKNATTVTLTKLKPGAATFRVRAKIKRDFSDYSSTVTITVL